jgi:hypothetical protein
MHFISIHATTQTERGAAFDFINGTWVTIEPANACASAAQAELNDLIVPPRRLQRWTRRNGNALHSLAAFQVLYADIVPAAAPTPRMKKMTLLPPPSASLL